jgi:hypothetical protein
VVEVAAEKNSTLVLPFPVELLRFLERATPEETTTPELSAPRPATAALRSPAPTTASPTAVSPTTVNGR